MTSGYVYPFFYNFPWPRKALNVSSGKRLLTEDSEMLRTITVGQGRKEISLTVTTLEKNFDWGYCLLERNTTVLKSMAS